MKISKIITDKYKLYIPPTVYYSLLADVREVEEDQKPCEVVLNKIRSEVEDINPWALAFAPSEYRDTRPKIVARVISHVLEIIDKYKEDT